MKRIFVLLLLLCLLSFCVPALAEDFTPMQVDFCKEYVTLRETASTSARAVDYVYIGEVVMAGRQKGKFTHCIYNGDEGYILTQYLTDEIEGYSEPCFFRICNCNEYISLRAFPMSGAEVLDKVPLGAVVKVIYHDDIYVPDLWACIQYNGQYGFTHWKYLEVVEYEGWQ